MPSWKNTRFYLNNRNLTFLNIQNKIVTYHLKVLFKVKGKYKLSIFRLKYSVERSTFHCIFLSCHKYVSEWIRNVKELLAQKRGLARNLRVSAVMDTFSLLRCNFLSLTQFLEEKPGVPHINEILFLKISLSTYNYTQKTCMEVRA